MAQGMDIDGIRAQLGQIVEHTGELERRFEEELARVHPKFRASARNLIAYLALRHVRCPRAARAAWVPRVVVNWVRRRRR